jgi:hypothetical protein
MPKTNNPKIIFLQLYQIFLSRIMVLISLISQKPSKLFALNLEKLFFIKIGMQFLKGRYIFWHNFYYFPSFLKNKNPLYT